MAKLKQAFATLAKNAKLILLIIIAVELYQAVGFLDDIESNTDDLYLLYSH